MLSSRVGRRKRHSSRRTSLAAFLGVAMLASNVSAVDILVTTDADSGAGSLREAFTNAASGDRIVFDIPGTPTITLLSDLPAVTGDISFANNNATPVSIDRNGNGPLDFQGSLVNPTVLVVNTGGGASPDTDILTAASTTVFGNGDVTGNLLVPGTIAPGASANAGTIGTLNVTGNLNLSNAQVQLDVSATDAGTTNDLINVVGTAEVTGATLAPNFFGGGFQVGQTFLVLDSSNPIVGSFTNQANAFSIADQPFLQAVQNTLLPSDDFGFVIEDNGVSFVSIADGCNQLSAAALLDQLRLNPPAPSAVDALRNGTTEESMLAFEQISGSIYATLISAEINHIQNTLESVRDRAALQFIWTPGQNRTWTPWARAYGISDEVDRDDCQTPGYRHRVGGAEIGCGVNVDGLLSIHVFSHLANSSLDTREVDQHADIKSYRLGGMMEYVGQHAYVIAAGGAGVQDYEVQRSLSALEGSTFAVSSFDGTSQFGYFETGINAIGPCTPYMALHTTRVDLDPINETGDADFALQNNGGDGDSLRGILGVSVTKSDLTPIGWATTRLRFGWLHEYLDPAQTFVSQIANSGTPTGALSDRGVDAGIDWGFVRLQLDMGVLLGGDFNLAYEGQYNSNAALNALLIGTRWVY